MEGADEDRFPKESPMPLLAYVRAAASLMRAPSPDRPAAPAARDTSADVIRAILKRLPDIDPTALVKAVYVVQVVHLGRHGRVLLPISFKAATLGVHHVGLASECRWRVGRRAQDRAGPPSLSPGAAAAVREVCDAFEGAPVGAFVAATQRPGGAWHSLWSPDPTMRMSISDPRRHAAYPRPVEQGPVIDEERMLLDYRLLTGAPLPEPLPAAA